VCSSDLFIMGGLCERRNIANSTDREYKLPPLVARKGLP
jgi:hypothetical protein